MAKSSHLCFLLLSSSLLLLTVAAELSSNRRQKRPSPKLPPESSSTSSLSVDLQHQMNNRCAKFKMKPLEHLDLMERMYSGAAATGKHVWTPIEIRDEDVDVANADADSGMGPLSASTPPRPGHDTVRENVVHSSLFDDAPPYSNDDRSANAKHRKWLGPGIVASSMDNLVEAVSRQSRELKITQYVATWKGEDTVDDCLARLMNTPGLEPSGQLFSFACSTMDSPDNRDIMMALPLDYVVNWLKEKRASTPQNVGREHQRDVHLFESDGVVDMD